MPSINIALIPLDERPVNTRYPRMIADIAGVNLLLPPSEILGYLRLPANLEELSSWLQALVNEKKLETVIVSCDFLGYGNLINSRISNDSALCVLSRLQILEQIGSKIPIHAFSLITRVSNANDNVEEPLYWDKLGQQFYAYSKLTHESESEGTLSLSDNQALSWLNENLPHSELSDWLNRRLRNHTVNLSLVDLTLRNKIESLLITSDDTAPYGFPSRERDWLSKWLQLSGDSEHRIQMHPGADEVGSALVAKTINSFHGCKPKVWVDYCIPADTDVIARYEDRPISVTVKGQIDACGCILCDSIEDSDYVLAVVTPSRRRIDYRKELADQDIQLRAPFYTTFLERLSEYQSRQIPVALADVVFPNGSDPQFSSLLLAPSCWVNLPGLLAYGAWNTAGNTLGSVVAQASCALNAHNDFARINAQSLFLAHRFLEDYGYQQIVRREARSHAISLWGRQEPDPNLESEQELLCRFIEHRLDEVLKELRTKSIGVEIEIVSGSVRLPWKRTFEVDFELRHTESHL